jgi:predicted nucleic acid-binding protein
LNALVIDGSTILGVVLKDEHSLYTAKAMEAIKKRPSMYVPSHWLLETTNGLLMAERRKRLSQVEVLEALEFIQALPMITDEQTASRCAGDILSIARHYALTIYDAAYLELAIRRRTTLATIDKALARAATAAGVELLT